MKISESKLFHSGFWAGLFLTTMILLAPYSQASAFVGFPNTGLPCDPLTSMSGDLVRSGVQLVGDMSIRFCSGASFSGPVTFSR